MLLVRFAVMILLTVAAIAAVAVLDTWWSVMLTVAVALGLLALAIVDIARYLRDGDDESVADDEIAQPPVFADEPASPEFIMPPAGRRLLLVATEALDAQLLEEALDGEDPHEVYVIVIAPQLVGHRADLWFGDAGEAHPRAQWVLDETLVALKTVGVRAHGHVGAPELGVAVTDGLRAYGPELVVVARRRSDPHRHLEDMPLDDTVEPYGVDLREIDLSRIPTLSK